MSLPSDHGVLQLGRMLDALDGRTVRIDAARTGLDVTDEGQLRELEERLARVRRHNEIRRGR